MPAFRKKPFVVQATQWFKDGDHPAVFLHEGGGEVWVNGVAYINTLEGRHMVTPGDWIITGIAGEFYPCKPNIFAASYTPVDDNPAAGWQPIETAPRDGTLVDLWLMGYGRYVNCAWRTVDGDDEPGWSGLTNDGWVTLMKPFLFRPSHWRHLPSPPVGERA